MRTSIHRGAIPLPSAIINRCIALVSIGNILELYTPDMVDVIDGIMTRMMTNQITLTDLQSARWLCVEVMNHDDVMEDLFNNVQDLSDVIGLFIKAAYEPSRPCSWS